MGGTATYSPRSARALGRSVAVVTSAEPDYDLEEALTGIPVALLPAAATTTFENIYTPAGVRFSTRSLNYLFRRCAPGVAHAADCAPGTGLQ